MYKIAWSLIKAKQVHTDENTNEWVFLHKAVSSKIKDLDPTTLTNMIVLLTLGKENSTFFSEIEAELIIKMQHMNLGDLVNLLWSA